MIKHFQRHKLILVVASLLVNTAALAQPPTTRALDWFQDFLSLSIEIQTFTNGLNGIAMLNAPSPTVHSPASLGVAKINEVDALLTRSNSLAKLGIEITRDLLSTNPTSRDRRLAQSVNAATSSLTSAQAAWLDLLANEGISHADYGLRMAPFSLYYQIAQLWLELYFNN